jgi:hypothetical protein
MSETHANFVDRILEKLPLDPGTLRGFLDLIVAQTEHPKEAPE